MWCWTSGRSTSSDSTGLGIMLDADHRAAAQGGVFTIIPGDAAMALLTATGLSDRLRLGTATGDPPVGPEPPKASR